MHRLARPSRAIIGLSAALAAVAAFAILQGVAGAAATGETITPVIDRKLPNLPGNSLTAVVVEYAPGGRSAAHHHAGSVFAYVLEGAVRSKLDDGSEIVYAAGESFFEPPGTHHAVSENASTTAPAKLLAVIVAETGATLTTFEE
jgi:quercetin dioxygenase-like cupin family protein